jgi:hypothetical protein
VGQEMGFVEWSITVSATGYYDHFDKIRLNIVDKTVLQLGEIKLQRISNK